jgi:shikimate kinase
MKYRKPLVAALSMAAFFVIGQLDAQQTNQDPVKSSAEEDRARQTLQERQDLYERFYREMCEQSDQCTDICKKVYSLVQRKEKLKLKCL